MLADVIMRLCRLGSSSSQGDPLYYLLIFYMLGFIVLIVLAELRIKKYIIYIEFLRGRGGKGIFLALVGLLIFDDVDTSDTIIGIILFLVGFFNIVVSCMRNDFPKPRKIKRR
jgi:hypothetical protein